MNKHCKAHTGKIVHIGVETPNFAGNGGVRFTALLALCGKRPDSRSLTHGYMETSRQVNCPACIGIAIEAIDADKNEATR